tara:strand:- start:21143 stop:21685 length:543 start_codon:yes stop_codon:yes gene_type:complete
VALKKEDKVRLEVIEKTFSMLVSNNMSDEQVLSMMQPQFDDFETITGHKLKPVFEPEPSISVLDLSKDFLRIRYPNEDNRVLRAKVEGVSIEVKLFKNDDFSFTNNDVVSALKSLSEKVDILPVELKDLEPCDVKEKVSEIESAMHSHGYDEEMPASFETFEGKAEGSDSVEESALSEED